ncbi:MAG: ABC transporter substrate-binding protein [Acidimicrobiia bacterium]
MRESKQRVSRRGMILLAALALIAFACGGTTATTTEPGGTAAPGDTQPAGDRSINVAIVGNPQMEDIASLTPELFTADTGIAVEYTVLVEQNLREIVTRDVGVGGSQFDVVMIGMFEAPQFGQNGWLANLTPYAEADTEYNFDDLIPTVRDGLSFDGALYAAPFYAESSFLMYRQDVIDEAGLTMPEAPTWDEVAEIARAVDSDEMAGICLRGKPGWGDLGASFTTVLNTFGGTWWAANPDGSIGAAQVDQPEFAEALNFYVDLVNDAGQDDAANSSFNECLGLYLNGQVAMWYDATVAAGLLEAEDSAVKGLNGYALAPSKVTDTSGWLWAWALAIPENAADPDTAWEYISWATSAQYIEAAGEALAGGWAAVPPGTRQSTYDNPNYQEAAAAFAQKTFDAMVAAPVNNPGTTPRPGLPAVQFVGVPEFQDVGTRCTQEFSAAIAGGQSVEDSLVACQAIASEVSS